MTADFAFAAHARTDLEDRLIEAEEPLAGFHLRAGGELPGALVTPALIEMVRKARRYNLRLARAIRAQDDSEAISAWVEVVPDEQGTSIAVSNWQARALPEQAATQSAADRVAIAAHRAGLAARLDNAQRVLDAESFATDTADVARAMRSHPEAPWTDFVKFAGSQHQQPLHWRLLDGAELTLPGSSRQWSAVLVPQVVKGTGLAGFNLYIVPDKALPEVPVRVEGEAERRGIGRDIAPVLRQPVSRIIANAETIRTQLAGPLAEEYSAYAADISIAGEHLLALIDDLTTLEIIEDEKFSPAPDHIDLADVARRATGILAMRSRERGIVLDAPDADESAPALAEFRRALQILLNLVGNAIRYSPEGAQVWLRIENGDGRARITVADQGEGLDEDEQDRVFRKFERLGRRGDGGSGLGLYISRRLAEAMGGTLTVESAKG